MTQKEIFNLLANGIIDDLPVGQQFKEVVLNIMCLKGVVEFNGYYSDINEQRNNLDVSMGYIYAKAVLELHEITQSMPPVHINWNRAIYRLYPDAKMSIEYSWDEQLQNEVDRLNSE
jgi:hypothetical protein